MHKSHRSALFYGVGAAVLAVASMAQPAQAGAARDIVRVSVASNEAGGGLRSWSPSISADGRFVAFHSDAPNLVAGDSGDGSDVFVRDRRTGTTELVSVGLDGSPAGGSHDPATSSDGRFVAFLSWAPDLVTGDANAEWDLFVRDRVAGVTERLTALQAEPEAGWALSAPSMSADGRYVAYSLSRTTWNSRRGDVYVYDRVRDTAERVGGLEDGSVSDRGLSGPAISADGSAIAYRTYKRGSRDDPASSDSEVFVHDRTTGRTEEVDDGAGGGLLTITGPPSLSADGRFVAFSSGSADLVADDGNDRADVFVHDRATGATERITPSPGASASAYALSPALSSDGQYVAFVVDDGTSSADEIVVHDRTTGGTRLVTGGDPAYSKAGSPVFAGAGRYLAFLWNAPNLDRWDTNRDEDVFVYDQLGGGDLFDRDAKGVVPCPDATSASVTCTVDRKGRTVLTGSWYDEALVGTGGADVMRGGRGSDYLTGRRGADMIIGGPGRDALLGGGGVDRLKGGSGPDWFRGGGGHDAYFGGRGQDRIDAGGQRREIVDCGAGDDDRVRGARADRVRADCENVRKWGGFAITDANAYGGGW